MKVCVIGSGSTGNMTYVETKEGKFLIDAGISLNDAILRTDDIDFSSIDGIFVTHSHWDHINYLDTVAKKTNAIVYLSHECFDDLKPKIRKGLINHPLSFIEGESIYHIKDIDLYTFQYFDENYAQELINKVDEQLSPTPRVCSVCGAPITKYSTSGKCSNCVRLNPNKPSREVLKEEIYTMSFEAIGRKYNLSGSAIKKWCKTYNLPAKKTDINKYTREEWDKL